MEGYKAWYSYKGAFHHINVGYVKCVDMPLTRGPFDLRDIEATLTGFLIGIGKGYITRVGISQFDHYGKNGLTVRIAIDPGKTPSKPIMLPERYMGWNCEYEIYKNQIEWWKDPRDGDLLREQEEKASAAKSAAACVIIVGTAMVVASCQSNGDGFTKKEIDWIVTHRQ